MKIQNILLILLVGFLIVASVNAQAVEVDKLPTVKVTGTAEIQVVPDTATLSFTVSKKNNVVAVAKKQSDETIAKVTDLAKRFGVAATDVKTDYIRVKEATKRAKIKDSDGDYEMVPDGFLVSRNLVVKLRDISKFEAFLTALLDAGVNDVGNVVFSSSELRKYKDQARAQAIDAAKEKAQAFAQRIGQNIGRAVSIEENDVDGYRNPTANYSQNSVSVGDSNAPEISAVGTISVKAQVEVKFLLN
jgi:uncharacterized protein